MLSLKEVFAKQGNTTQARVLLVRPKLMKTSQPQALVGSIAAICLRVHTDDFLISAILASVGGLISRADSWQACALRGLFSLTKSAVSLPSSQPRQLAAAPAPQTCATSSSRLEARGGPRAPSYSTTAPSASCMTWSRALAFRRPSLPLLTESFLNTSDDNSKLLTLLLVLKFCVLYCRTLRC